VTVAAVVLAAGTGSRFGGAEGSKLLAACGGEPVVGRAIDAAVASGLAVLVVHGAVDLAGLITERGATPVANPRFAEGMATSLQAGLTAAGLAGFDAVVVGLGDQPGVLPATWAELARTASPIAVATYAGRRGNPVRLEASVWPLVPTTGDAGARELLRDRPDLVVEVPSRGTPADVDTPSDLERWTT
jgi:CTP:molybdopterin cytidylyltransferase MocA